MYLTRLSIIEEFIWVLVECFTPHLLLFLSLNVFRKSIEDWSSIVRFFKKDVIVSVIKGHPIGSLMYKWYKKNPFLPYNPEKIKEKKWNEAIFILVTANFSFSFFFFSHFFTFRYSFVSLFRSKYFSNPSSSSSSYIHSRPPFFKRKTENVFKNKGMEGGLGWG